MSLLSLLGLQQASTMAAPNQVPAMAAPDPLQELPPVEAAPQDQIIVQGNMEDDYILENPTAVKQRDFGNEANQAASDHRGMFGTRGTLRDILGVVGDAFLVQSGNKAIYQPKREQEKLSDAMAGFTGSGEDAMAAIERAAGINPAVAQEMLEQYQMNQYRTAQAQASGSQAATAAGRESRMGRESAMDYVSQTYAAAVASGDPAALTKAQELAGLVSKQYGIPMEELGVNPGMTPGQAAILAGRGATVNQNLRLPQYDRGLDIREDQVDISRGNLSERRRSNRVREGQAAENEEGRMNRAELTDRRVRELDEGGGSNGAPRQLRGSGSTQNGQSTTGRVISRRRVQE